MADQATVEVKKTTYRVQGFSCANCANTFEKNVKDLHGVVEAQVNFGASKLTVYGDATVEDLERAGAFEHLKVRPENEKAIETKEPFWKVYGHVIVSALLLLVGVVSYFMNGEGHLWTVSLFASSIVIGGYSLFKAGFYNLIRLRFDMKTLMTVAVIGAALIGEWLEGAVVVILFAISEALERFSMDRARQSIRSLVDMAPKEALVRRNGEELVIPVEAIEVGDIMLIKPGQKLAMDGIVRSGRSSMNEAAITGESVPVEKMVGDDVFAGTLNEEGFLEVEVTKRVEDTTLAKIIHLVEEAQGERAPSQAFVDTFAKYYTPAIMVIAALVATVPPLFFAASWETWIYQGLAVLVVGCPCALVISTPVSIVTAIGNAARHGILVKGGIYLEEAARLRAVAFDKTGTLTKGKPAVTDYQVYDADTDGRELLAAVAALEYRSQHPLAAAVMKKADDEQLSYTDMEVSEFSSITGKGIAGTVNGIAINVGKPALFGELPPAIEADVARLQAAGKTVMLIGAEQKVLALLAVADEVREVSRTAVERLHALGITKTVMLTGDNRMTARAIGKQVGVAEVEAELLPEDKLGFVKGLKEEHGRVAMIGDGVNDAPALAASSVGVAMGGAGTDTALETADVALMGDDLRKLPFLIRLSRKALLIIKENIAFSLGIKLVALLLVAPGWLTLWIAILADMGATLLVTLNGLRLLRMKDE
ncbi:cadmium-translocating P-type ATPase [Halalkalibacterium halodurans]|uniref:heavy metal translocating P-type ATPase n=1 Tax=Halalkalibacterium halodurans TaxID=86665 RepID=UPI001067BDCC|nr:heavy metal translocating P-type ATPase [Halalkalibacterium halodurans]TES50195.1 cadmium-translocating P-type ATPase [Halalkalibacterium halodurans]